MKKNLNMKKILKKLNNFWEDTEAISPVVATILVLAVAVAAGLGLYLWFNPFQAGVQAQVENSSSSSVNLMSETTMGNNVLKVTLPAGLFEYKSENVDEDNDELIYKPNASGNYTKLHSKYKNTWREERFIQEIPVYIENRGPKDMTGVTIRYTQLASTLNNVLRLDRNNSYQLLDLNGTPVNVKFTDQGAIPDKNYSYYFGEASSYGMDYSAFTDPAYKAPDAYLPIMSSTFATNRITSTRVYTEDGNTKYAIAKFNGVSTGWDTSGSFFATALNNTLYKWATENLDSNTYKVGTLKPGETKKVYTYYFLSYLKASYCSVGTSLTDCTVNLPIQVSTDQGAVQTVTATMHLVDKPTVAT